MFIISSANCQDYKPDSIGKAWFPDAKFGIFVHWIMINRNRIRNCN